MPGPGATTLDTSDSATGEGDSTRASRRRRRSPSTDTEIGGSSEHIITIRDQVPNLSAYLSNQHTPAPGQEARSPKRRRLMKKAAMRLDPDSSSSNGPQHHANGSSPKATKNGTSISTNGHSSPSNGTRSPTQNGFSKSDARKQVGYFGHDREEVTRLMIQGLEDLGYRSAANRLGQESGYEVESPGVAAFRNAIIQGDWSEAESLLFGVRSEADGGGVSISNGDWQHFHGLQLAEEADSEAMRFLIREQKYLEFLENQDTGKAMMVLRHELQPLRYNRGRLDALSRSAGFSGTGAQSEDSGNANLNSYLVCPSVENLREDAQWDGALGQSRQILLQQLSSKAKPSICRNHTKALQDRFHPL